jgi:2-keto-4-pentenoate hydratase/2-oxohepta-3-ene-1,7-dioic acid hydratase in catechol pathway
VGKYADEGYNGMKLYLGLTESSAPHHTRIFGELDGKLIDLQLAHAAQSSQSQRPANSYDLAAYYFPPTMSEFLERGQAARAALEETMAFARVQGVGNLRGPAGERLVYERKEVRLMPPFKNPRRSFVIGYSDRARTEALPKPELPTGFYKLPSTFVTDGAPIIWPKFSNEVDADACVAIVIGKGGRRIAANQAWNHIAGAALLIDFTARDVNRREGLTTNNLLGKNFPSSTSIGPAVLVGGSHQDLKNEQIELSVDGVVRQKFKLSQCVFSVEQIIAHWSIVGLEPGDFLAIGASMSLRGDRLENPAPLKIGSTIRCSSPALGELTHRVVGV